FCWALFFLRALLTASEMGRKSDLHVGERSARVGINPRSWDVSTSGLGSPLTKSTSSLWPPPMAALPSSTDSLSTHAEDGERAPIPAVSLSAPKKPIRQSPSFACSPPPDIPAAARTTRDRQHACGLPGSGAPEGRQARRRRALPKAYLTI